MLCIETLLAMFWDGHTPTSSWSSQYRAALFADDDVQLEAARQSAQRLQQEIGQPIATEIAVGVPFYPAEGYHQKYRLRQQPALFEQLSGQFGSEAEMLASTPAAKLNAYVGGHATREQVQTELAASGLALSGSALTRRAAAG